MKRTFKQVVSWMIVLCMALSLIPAVHAGGVSWEKTDRKLRVERPDSLVKQDLTDVPDDSEMVRVSIVLEELSTVEAGYATMGIAENREAMAYRARLQAQQKRMEQTISAKALNGKPLDVVWNMTLVGNIISAWVPYGSLEKIAAVAGVKTVAREAWFEPCAVERSGEVNPNAFISSSMTGTTPLWNGGYTGAGTRIAVIDTGIDASHQSLDNGAYLHALEKNAAAKGMSVQDYRASLDLLTPEKIARVLPQMNLHNQASGVTAAQLYRNDKLAFGYNYVDISLNIDHNHDQQGEHGSHVAGIAAANRFIPQNGGYADARDSVQMMGVAPDAQLITMKVFGQLSPYESDYMVAIEDAILLDCDVVNLSLGTTAPGSPYSDVYGDLLEMMTHTDTVVVISAGNAGNWAQATPNSYLYHDDVSFDMVGSPGSYGSAFTVASVDSAGTAGYCFRAAGQNIYYAETLGFGNAPFAGLDASRNGTGTDYSYIFLDGLGYAGEYSGINVSGKIVFVSRGTLNFSEKANNALSRGAAAVVVYNNEPGISNMDLTGLSYYAPVVSITQAEGAAIREASENKGSYRTGTMTVYGKVTVSGGDAEYYTMSDFSSWGVPGDLSLKPEITAPGGNIYSLWGTNAFNGGGSSSYEFMSGTSMAAPQVAGMTALLSQVFRERGLTGKTGMSLRHLAQSLLMSTAQPLFEENSGGGYYSLLSQGAGLARVDLASQAESYILVKGQEDGKVKAELGDDPGRTGVYTFDFTIHNLTGGAKVYALDADVFRQDVFEKSAGSDILLLNAWTTGLDASVRFTAETLGSAAGISCDLNGDGTTNSADADYLLEYTLGNVTALKANGDVSGDGTINSYDAHLLLASLGGDTVTVPANGAVTVGVEIALTGKAKAELNALSPKGAYVEAYVYARGVADAEGNVGTVHSIPMLAYYGNWSDPSMFDRGTLLELEYGTCSVQPYLQYVVGNGGNCLGIDYGDGMEYYFGGNPVTEDAAYLPERAAFNSQDASRLTEQCFTLIRGAGAARIRITNAATGEVYFQRELGELQPAYYNPSTGTWENTVQSAMLNWTGLDSAGVPLAEGTKINISLTAVPHYYRQSGGYAYEGLGQGSTMTTAVTIDNTAPQILNIDGSRASSGVLSIRAKDNGHISAVALLNANGSRVFAVESPNQTVKNQEISLNLDISKATGKRFVVAVFDYAGNQTTYDVTLDRPEVVRDLFTAIDTNKGSFVSLDQMGSVTELMGVDFAAKPCAAEYVDGHTFVIDVDETLWVARDTELSELMRIGKLTTNHEARPSIVRDMAYNYADGQMYLLMLSQYNENTMPYLATLDLTRGEVKVLCEMPVDVHTLAIDGRGNCYSAAYGATGLYRYTVAEAKAGNLSYVGTMGYYSTYNICSMTWDHSANKLYWAFPQTLLEINPKTAEPTLMGYHAESLVGLYTRTGSSSGRFEPTNRIEALELNHSSTRILLNSTCTLEASIWPWNVSDRSVTWTSSNPAVAAVDSRGIVTAKTLGRCVITATSNLDPSKTASCTVDTFKLDKTLRGLIWDEVGEIWMSQFNTGTLPDFTKLSSKSLDHYLASATVGQDGTIYAASLDLSGYGSGLYKLDPVTYMPTLIGNSGAMYVDLAPAPGQPGNTLLAVGGCNVFYVNAETGDYYFSNYNFSNALVAIAYAGTEDYVDYGFHTKVDWYFLIDTTGTVFLKGFLEQDGIYYTLEHESLTENGVYTNLDFAVENDFYCSAYFDGSVLYYSAYRESRNDVTLLAVDVAGGSKACYTIGNFQDGIWPVAGLMEPGTMGGGMEYLSTGAKPVPVELTRQKQSAGGLNSAVQPLSSGEVRNEQVFVSLTMPAQGTNGVMTVSYDPAMLRLSDVQGRTSAFAWKQTENGKIRIAFAEGAEKAAETAVAALEFAALANGTTSVDVSWGEWGNGALNSQESLTLTVNYQKPHSHSYTATVTAPTCTDGGYTTYTCACGESYTTDYTPVLDHNWQGRFCTRCGEEKELFTDVPKGTFYYEPVLWAVDQGITTGTTATTFSPDGKCLRAQVVTFLHRAAKNPVPASTNNPFRDVKASDFFYTPVLWAVEQGITNGVSANEFGSYANCNRAAVVTFLWRAAGSPEPKSTSNPFKDVSSRDFFYKPVLWAVENGITNGISATEFGPAVDCNRAQVVTFLYRARN